MCQILHTIQPQETGTKLTAFFQLKQDHYQTPKFVSYSGILIPQENNTVSQQNVTTGVANFN